MGKRKNTYKPKKRKYSRNQYDSCGGSGKDNEHDTNNLSCSSAKKLKKTPCMMQKPRNITASHFLMMDFDVLKSILKLIGCCPDCHGHDLMLENIVKEKMGWANKLSIFCNSCAWEETFFTSRVVESKDKKDRRGRKKYEVNVRCVMSFREIGGGLELIRKFSTMMNMTQPMNRSAYDDTNEFLLGAYSKACTNSMSKAAHEYKQTQDSPVDCTVSIDGSWQKRGFDSQNGLVTAIIRGTNVVEKCIDFEVLTKKCKPCQVWDKRKGTPEYATWFDEHQHDCRLNHYGLAG